MESRSHPFRIDNVIRLRDESAIKGCCLVIGRLSLTTKGCFAWKQPQLATDCGVCLAVVGGLGRTLRIIAVVLAVVVVAVVPAVAAVVLVVIALIPILVFTVATIVLFLLEVGL